MYNGFYVVTCTKCGKVVWSCHKVDRCFTEECDGKVINEIPADRDQRLGIRKGMFEKVIDPLIVGK
ncbi:MAG: hypothetical protein E7265_06730 [Lachnospiraceae bacterium]|nr:hypothetical protein [Lachnospiraceae bacterium]